MKKITKKFWAFMLVCSVVLTMVPMTVYGAGESNNVVTCTSLDELRTELGDGESGETIEVVIASDETVSQVITISNGENVTIKSNGLVTITTNVEDAFTVYSGTLTFGKGITVNAGIEKSALLYADGAGNSNSTIGVSNASSKPAIINIDGATLNAVKPTNMEYALAAIWNDATLNMNSGAVNSWSTVFSLGKLENPNDNSKLNINGGSVTSVGMLPNYSIGYAAIHSVGSAQINITGGSISSILNNGSALCLDGNSKATISGGIFSAKRSGNNDVSDGRDITTCNKTNGIKNVPNVVITGGTFANPVYPTTIKSGYVSNKSGVGYVVSRYVPSHSHSYREDVKESYKKSNATCKSKAVYYKSCSCGSTSTSTFEYGELAGHNLIPVWPKPATCIENGTIPYYVCLTCDKKFSDIECKNVVTDIIDVAKGHMEVVAEAKEPTCSEEGLTEGTKCSVCDESIVAQEKIPTIEHTIVEVEGKEATCEEDGNDPYYTCEVCGGAFADVEGKIVIDKESVIRPKLTVGITNKIEAITTKSSLIEFAWEEVENATGYRVFVAENGQWSYLSKAQKETSFTATELEPGTEYRFAVRAYRIENNKVVWADTYKAANFLTAPGITSDIRVGRGYNSIKLTWEAVEGATGYRVYIRNTETNAWEPIKKATSKLTFRKNGLESGASYKFAVRAYRVENEKVIWADKYKTVTGETVLKEIEQIE
ncbi:MAG: hypothetical protein E7262_02060 [Lachnospiraceae bacterium]|nr:hypothetical protein [Lachnospiraceae bacterium]